MEGVDVGNADGNVDGVSLRNDVGRADGYFEGLLLDKVEGVCVGLFVCMVTNSLRFCAAEEGFFCFSFFP